MMYNHPTWRKPLTVYLSQQEIFHLSVPLPQNNPLTFVSTVWPTSAKFVPTDGQLLAREQTSICHMFSGPIS